MHLSLKRSIIYHCKFKYAIEEYSDVLESWIRKFEALRDSIQSCSTTIRKMHSSRIWFVIEPRDSSRPVPMTHYPTFNRADRMHVRLRLSRIMPLFGCNLPFRKSALPLRIALLYSPLFFFLLFHKFYSITRQIHYIQVLYCKTFCA